MEARFDIPSAISQLATLRRGTRVANNGVTGHHVGGTMLKITAQPLGLGARVLRVEGRLAGPWVAELQEHCERALADGMELTLEMSGVHFADPDGRRLLRELIYRSVTLIGRTPFVAAQLGAEEP